jgi:hypothetical protein
LDVSTIPDDRPISDAEVELVAWLLSQASTAGDLSELLPSVPTLRVVGRCSCGCPSVDFAVNGQGAGAAPIADSRGKTAEGVEVGVILWGRDGAVTGLELYEFDQPVRSLPQTATLSPWPPS